MSYTGACGDARARPSFRLVGFSEGPLEDRSTALGERRTRHLLKAPLTSSRDERAFVPISEVLSAPHHLHVAPCDLRRALPPRICAYPEQKRDSCRGTAALPLDVTIFTQESRAFKSNVIIPNAMAALTRTLLWIVILPLNLRCQGKCLNFA